MVIDPSLLLDQPTPKPKPRCRSRRSSSLSSISEDISSLKRRKLDPSSSSSDHHFSLLDVGRIVWVDISCDDDHPTYWWPGTIQKTDVVVGTNDISEQNSLSVELFSEKNKKSKALAGSKIRLLSSFKNQAIKPFTVLTDFQPRQFNPILKTKSFSIHYPTERSLLENYALAYETHSTSGFDNQENLPDVGICMIPLSQASLKSKPLVSQSTSSSSYQKLDTSDNENDQDKHDIELLDEDLDLEIDVSNEAVLSKDKLKGEYWPAKVVSYVGLKNVARKRGPGKKGSSKNKINKEKFYEVKFCDSSQVEIPRSWFLTSDQADFHTVPIGQIKTARIKFEDLVEQLEVHLDEMDLIVKGKSSDPSIQSQHEKFINNSKTRGSIPNQVKYGKYHEEIILQVGQYLESRYLHSSSDSQSQEYAEGFKNLAENHKTQYILDILVPQLLWLVTVEQYKPDAIEELGEDSNPNDILEKAKELAQVELHEADIVDQVYTLRNSNVQVDDLKIQKKQIKRNTSNSQKSLVDKGDDDSDF